MSSNIGTTEIVIVAVTLLVIFGGKKIPELIRGFAEAIREFRRSSSDKS